MLALWQVDAAQMLFDFGHPGLPTQEGGGGSTLHWNNITPDVAQDDFGYLYDLVDTEGNVTQAYLEMWARFNEVNENGTLDSTLYPVSATRDSCYGNTESFNNVENILPEFDVGSLTLGTAYSLTFYASRMGVGDNRETRYTVTGATTAVADLNVANNIDGSITVSGMQPNAEGRIKVEISPGPNNDNANHFTYLAVLQVDTETAGGPSWLFDFGGTGSLTEPQEPQPDRYWNNVTTVVGQDDAGVLADLVTSDGVPTGASLTMVSRFNGANTAGSTAAAVYPVSATQDSLFGNTESFDGLANVLPVFKLTGLEPTYSYNVTFYASRTGVSDNRETRYALSGANAGQVELDTANNIENSVQVTGIQPDGAGEITVSITPGPNNNNGNHFTYLGVMEVNWTRPYTPRVLVDFGAPATTTEFGLSGVQDYWNNVTSNVGSTDNGVVPNLQTVDGSTTPVGIQMVARFNGANENGTQDPAPFAVNASRDSLFGNTEDWSGLADVFPVFKLTGLTPGTVYDLTFYASRMGVSDIRETRYTITGAGEVTADFDPANNVDQSLLVENVEADASGEITIGLTPGPNNSNGNHFTYLGVLQIDWEEVPTVPAKLADPTYADGVLTFRLEGTAGAVYRIDGSVDLSQWTEVKTVPLSGSSETVPIDTIEARHFYRAVSQ